MLKDPTLTPYLLGGHVAEVLLTLHIGKKTSARYYKVH